MSAATVQLAPGALEATLSFSARELEQLVPLDVDHDGHVSEAEFGAGRDTLAATVVGHVQITVDGTAARLEGMRARLDGKNNIEFQFSSALPSSGRIQMTFEVIRLLAPGHRMFFSLRGPAGRPPIDQLLKQDSPVVSFESASAAPGAPYVADRSLPTFGGFVGMGITHIGTGYDHLLFLFTLLLVSRNFRSSLLLITSFTLAHSLTLAVATFDLVRLPSTITEPLIALTIVYVGLENVLRKGDPAKRCLLTFLFGLIHGFGFASVLRELGVGAHGGGAVMALFSFNLGVELGQLAIVAIALPVLWRLRAWPPFQRWGVPACSLVASLFGAFWFVGRVLP